jgi:hypothetical protein
MTDVTQIRKCVVRSFSELGGEGDDRRSEASASALLPQIKRFFAVAQNDTPS